MRRRGSVTGARRRSSIVARRRPADREIGPACTRGEREDEVAGLELAPLGIADRCRAARRLGRARLGPAAAGWQRAPRARVESWRTRRRATPDRRRGGDRGGRGRACGVASRRRLMPPHAASRRDRHGQARERICGRWLTLSSINADMSAGDERHVMPTQRNSPADSSSTTRSGAACGSSASAATTAPPVASSRGRLRRADVESAGRAAAAHRWSRSRSPAAR